MISRLVRTNSSADMFTPEETQRRRDEVIRRMANTPPQPNGKPKPRHRGKKKSTVLDRVPQKSAPDRGT